MDNIQQQLDLPFEDKIHLLVVDDNADTRAMIAHFFSGHGYQVSEAESGRQALYRVDRDPSLDVVLLDLFIPGTGGMEVLSQIYQRGRRPGVIVVSALGDREIAAQALRLGAFEYIQKPFDLSRLESSVVACAGHVEYHEKQIWWKRLIEAA